MMRALLLMTALSACTTSDAPTVTVAVTDAQSVSISLERSPEHSFGALVATVNGVDAGAAEIDPGHVPAPNTSPFADQSSPSFATFLVPIASLHGPAVHVELTEDSDHFVIDVPEFLAPRAIQIVTPPNTQFHANDQIEVSSGVASDTLGGGFEALEGDADCFTSWATIVGPTTVAYTMPPDLTQFWGCSVVQPAPPPGGTLPTTLDLDVSVVTPVAQCEGPDLTCAPATAPTLTAKVPVTLAF
ncbi:MAG: hypothetical protein ABI591_10640 [Kofleriaceae bacterium]